MEIKLGHKKDIQYTDDLSLQSFCDVKIISADHQLFYINRSLLAVHSQLFRQILSNLSTVPFLGDEIAISTNLKSDDLFAIVEFMVKGSIQIFTDPLFEGTELSVDPELSESFEAMGIPVKSLNLSPETVSNLSQMETEASDWGPSVFPDFEEDENFGLDFEDGNDSVELSKPKRGRPRKNEVRTPSRKLSPPKNKLYSPPFADEFQDPESIIPKDYKGKNLKLPHINLYRWKFLPPFAKERLLCKANGLEVPIRRKRQRKESEELMSEDPVESTSFEFAPRSLRERITNPSFESDANDDDDLCEADIQQMKEEPIDDSDLSYDENEAVAKEEHDDYSVDEETFCNFVEIAGPKKCKFWITDDIKGYIVHKRKSHVSYVKCVFYTTCQGKGNIRNNYLKTTTPHTCQATMTDLEVIRRKMEMKLLASATNFKIRTIYDKVMAETSDEVRQILTYPKVLHILKYHRSIQHPEQS